MNTIFILGIVQALFMLLLLWSKKQWNRSVILLGIWLILMASSQGYYVILFAEELYLPDTLLMYWSVCPLLASMVFFFYVQSICGYVHRKWWAYGLHAVPPIGYLSLLTYLITVDAPLYLSDGFILSPDAAFDWFVNYYGYLFALVPLTYIIWALLLMKGFQGDIRELYSNVSDFELQWVQFWIWCFLVVFVISFPVVFVSANYQLLVLSYSFQIIGTLNTIYIFLLGYFGFKKTNLFQEAGQSLKKTKTYEKSGLSDDRIKKLASQLSSYMETGRPYLNPKLDINQLAQDLNISTHHLSQLINQFFGVSFYRLINQYRVNEVIRQMREKHSEHLTLLAIALNSGFNSKATFNKAFKEETGQTPNQYKKRIK